MSQALLSFWSKPASNCMYRNQQFALSIACCKIAKTRVIKHRADALVLRQYVTTMHSLALY